MGEGDHSGDALLTDFYQLTMLAAYFARGMEHSAVFEFFVRRMPRNRNFLVAAGLEQLVAFLENLKFSEADLDWLTSTGRFDPAFLRRLAKFRFTGDVDAVPEGTVFFANEPIVRVTANLPEAQLVETRLINLMHFQTLIASKAARCVLAAGSRMLVDFGLRRAHGAEAGILAARAAYLAGFTGTATVESSRRFGIPLYGTMAHSFVQAHAGEVEAFRHFIECFPENNTLLIDTYDTLEGARKVVALVREFQPAGLRIGAVRIDSGDFAEMSRGVRWILDEGGCQDTKIFASGGLEETAIAALVASDIPIDGFGVGTNLDASVDEPVLDCAYKLQEYAGRPTRKRSSGKETWPGRKQIERHRDTKGTLHRDEVVLESDPVRGERLLVPVMRNGKRVDAYQTLAKARDRARRELASLPAKLRSMERQEIYEVGISPSIRSLAEAVDRDAAASD
ncbi:MAG: nicotinate phosphoribosyltransferase [Steroidobacteraceae bacterium]